MARKPDWARDAFIPGGPVRKEMARNARTARNTNVFTRSYGITETGALRGADVIGPRNKMGQLAANETLGAATERVRAINDVTGELSRTGKFTRFASKGLPVIALGVGLAGRIRKARKEKKAQ